MEQHSNDQQTGLWGRLKERAAAWTDPEARQQRGRRAGQRPRPVQCTGPAPGRGLKKELHFGNNRNIHGVAPPVNPAPGPERAFFRKNLKTN